MITNLGKSIIFVMSNQEYYWCDKIALVLNIIK